MASSELSATPVCHLPPTSLSLLQGMDVALFKEAYEGLKFDFLLSHAAYCRDVLKLKKGQRAVISNGRVSSHKHAGALCPNLSVHVH